MAGLATAFGSGAMTNSIADLASADVVLATGTNTTENHPVLSSVVKRGVRRGTTRLIVVDPRRIDLCRFAEIWLRPRLGTDLAWINGLLNVIIAEKLFDDAFIRERTENFDAVRALAADYPPEKVEEITGIPAADMIRAARLYAGANRAAILYAMGITQHTHGTDNVKALANLAMATGNVGRPGTGINPLRGQNNVQGACDMGGLPNVFPGYQRVNDGQTRERFQAAWGAPLSPEVGLTATEMMDRLHDGQLKGLFILGENPLLSDADASHAEAALRHAEFLVVQDVFLTETAELAHVVLPAACWAEKDGTFTNTERRVSRVRKAVDAPGSARPDLEILLDLLDRFGIRQEARTASAVMDEISGLTPSYGGIRYDRLEKEGLQWPCPNATHPGTPILHIGRFSRGLGLFSAVGHREPDEAPSARYPFLLTTGRVLYQYHTGTMTRRCEGLDYMAPRCEVEIHPRDAADLGVRTGDDLNLASRRGRITAQALVTERVPPKTVFVPFHYVEAIVNRLTNPARDPIAKIPEFKVCAVSVQRAG